MTPPPSTATVAGQLCLSCGLCCDGTLFKDVELQPGDDLSLLEAGGLSLLRRGATVKLTQPCTALDGCRCRVYSQRPTRCREFECLLLKSTLNGQTPVPKALQIIRLGRQKAERVRRLLQELGDENQRLPLSVRFRRMRQRFEKGGANEDAIERFGELTLAVHDLNVLLSQAFYPGDAPPQDA